MMFSVLLLSSGFPIDPILHPLLQGGGGDFSALPQDLFGLAAGQLV